MGEPMMTRRRTEVPSPREFYRLIKELTPPYPARWIPRYLFAPWTPYVSWFWLKLHLTANMVTVLGGGFIVLGSILLVLPYAVGWVIGAVLVLMFYVMDICDGDVARFNRHVGSGSFGIDGAYMDNLMHGVEPLVAAALGYRLYATGQVGLWPLVLAATAMVAVTIDPHRKYCETVLSWAQRQTKKDGNFRLDEKVFTGVPLLFGSSYGNPRQRLLRLLLAIKFLLLCPGYFLTLVAVVVLDVVLGKAFVVGDATIHWRFLWLALYTAGKVLYAVYWSFFFARKLRSIPA